MPMLNIHMEVRGSELNVNHETVMALCDKFLKKCDKLEASPLEVGVAIGLMQEHMLKECGVLPVTEAVMSHIKAIASHEDEADPSELKSTVDDMLSDDYKKRFVAEYRQTKIRYDKLDAMTVKYEAGTLDFKPDCPLELLKEQKGFMGNYLRCLKKRAEIEGIDLEG